MTIRTIVKRYEGVFQRGFLYDRGKRELRAFLAEPQTSCWLYADDRFKQITDLDQLGRNLSGSVLLQLTTNPIEFTLVWEVVTQHEVTCTVEVVAQARIVQGADFCARWQDCLQGGNVPDRVRIENRVVESKRPFVVDTLASYSFDQLVEKDEVPSAAWREWLCDAFVEWGFDSASFTIPSVKYSSPTEEMKKELAKRQTMYELERAEDDLNRARRTEQAQREAEEQEHQRQWEHAAHMGDASRRQELERLQREAEIERLQREQNWELQQKENEKKRLELEQEMIALRNRPGEQEEIRAALDKSAEQVATLVSGMAAIKDSIAAVRQEGIPLTVPLVAQLAGLSNQLPGRMTGFRDSRFFADFFQAKSTMKIKLDRARARDIGSGQRNMKVETLRIDESLAFEFLPSRSGYLSVINIGTSGRYWLHVPNAYTDGRAARVLEGQKESIPGPLLPSDKLIRYCSNDGQLGGYCEGGPVGWEQLIILVTPEPLFTPEDLFEAEQDAPFVRLSVARMEQLVTRILEMGENDWEAGVLGFSVVP